MQKTTSQKALKVISIIMIVFAALTLLLGIGGIVTGGALGILGAGSSEAPSTWPSASSACAAPTTRARSARSTCWPSSGSRSPC